MRSVTGLMLVWALPLISALECAKHDILDKYRINEYSISGESAQDTPPSETREKWWFSLCDEHDGKSSIPDQCDPKDVFCGVTTVSLPGKEALVTRVMDFPGSVAVEVKEAAEALTVKLSGASWGTHVLNAEILLKCEEKGSGSLQESKWADQNNIRLVFSGPFGCLKKDADKAPDKTPPKDGGDQDHGDKPKPKGGAGLGSWLVWLFMYAIIFALIYLLVTSYMSTRNGSFNDFRDEFVDRSTTFATNLPQFAKEVAGKIINSGSSSQRGGYSAV